MINFFRRIRQELLSDGKSAMYLKYAIGEILLVMIGILMALQINNWNTHRIERLREDSYLVNLKRDLNSQMEIIERNLTGELAIYNSLNKAQNNFNKHKRIRPLREDLLLITPINDRYTFTITSPTYTELLSTGHIDYITNEKFKTQLVKYYEDLELTSKVIQKNNDYKDNVVNAKTLAIFEIIGASDIDSTYRGLQATFDHYETPQEVMDIMESIIAKPENQLTLLNSMRLRRLFAQSHISRLEQAKNQTNTLLNKLDNLNE